MSSKDHVNVTTDAALAATALVRARGAQQLVAVLLAKVAAAAAARTGIELDDNEVLLLVEVLDGRRAEIKSLQLRNDQLVRAKNTMAADNLDLSVENQAMRREVDEWIEKGRELLERKM